jgi:hypothetical protein
MPIKNALASFADDENETQPGTLYPALEQENTWNAEFRLVDYENTSLRLVLEISDSIFYAETPAVFADYATTFSRENFSR